MKRVKQKVKIIFCMCGCGEKLNAYDSRNRFRNSLWGHLTKNNLVFFKKGQKAWNKGKKYPQFSGKNSPWYGRHHSEEAKRKLSEINKKSPTRYWLGKPRLDQRGKNSNFWTGENHKTERANAMETLEYKNWRRQVFERDDYTCQICNSKGKFLVANHILKWANYPDVRFNLINGIAICRKCDYKWVMRHEPEWESYFNFNLMVRGFL